MPLGQWQVATMASFYLFRICFDKFRVRWFMPFFIFSRFHTSWIQSEFLLPSDYTYRAFCFSQYRPRKQSVSQQLALLRLQQEQLVRSRRCWCCSMSWHHQIQNCRCSTQQQQCQSMDAPFNFLLSLNRFSGTTALARLVSMPNDAESHSSDGVMDNNNSDSSYIK